MPEVSPSKYRVQAGWDDVPHIDEATKAELLASTPPHLREARSKGIPSLGSGAIYPIPWEEVTCHPFVIPEFWKRGYALDVGWNKTAALWGAQDPADGTMYVYSEHYQGQQVPLLHAEAIKARGAWIKGAIDPAARGRSQVDGQKLLTSYKQAGLKLVLANNAVEAGIYEVWSLFSTGRLKLFTTLRNVQDEYAIYQRDENGKIVKKYDHLMDCLRYLISTWRAVASIRPMDRVAGQTAPAGPSDPTGGY